MKVLVVGTSGPIGQALAESCPPRVDFLTAGRLSQDWKLSIGGPIEGLPPGGVDCVVHLAWDTAGHIRDGDSRSLSFAKDIADWHKRSYRGNAPCFIFLSSQAAHSRSRSSYGRAKFMMETYISGWVGYYTFRVGVVLPPRWISKHALEANASKVAAGAVSAPTVAERVWGLLIPDGTRPTEQTIEVVEGHLSLFSLPGLVKEKNRVNQQKNNRSLMTKNIDRFRVLLDSLRYAN